MHAEIDNTIVIDAPDADTQAAAPPLPVSGVVMGLLAGFTREGAPLVTFEGNPAQAPVAARAFAALFPADIGKPVALQFERGDVQQAAVIGLLHAGAGPAAPHSLALPDALQVISEGDELRLVAKRKLTLQCGRASITLDVDGNVEIRGQDVLTRAAGQNRIKGSSISLN